MDRPRVDDHHEWIVLNDAPLATFNQNVALWDRVAMRGRGAERHGVLTAGSVSRAPATLVGLPSVDDLDD